MSPGWGLAGNSIRTTHTTQPTKGLSLADLQHRIFQKKKKNNATRHWTKQKESHSAYGGLRFDFDFHPCLPFSMVSQSPQLVTALLMNVHHSTFSLWPSAHTLAEGRCSQDVLRRIMITEHGKVSHCRNDCPFFFEVSDSVFTSIQTTL